MANEKISAMTALAYTSYTGEELSAVIQPSTAPTSNFKGAALAGYTSGGLSGTVVLGVGAAPMLANKQLSNTVIGARAGHTNLSNETSTVIIGCQADIHAGANGAVVIGFAAVGTGSASVSVGESAGAGLRSVCIGPNVAATGSATVAIGSGSSGFNENKSVHIGANSGQPAGNNGVNINNVFNNDGTHTFIHGPNGAALPTADPAVAGALYTAGVPSAGNPKALMVSGG